MENVKWISGKGHDFILPYRVRENRKDREATDEWNSLRKYRAAKRKGGTSFNPISRLEFRIKRNVFFYKRRDRSISIEQQWSAKPDSERNSIYRFLPKSQEILSTLLYTRFVQEFRKGNSERKSSKRGRDDERMREVTGDG